MPPRGSKTKRHPNGALELTFQVQGKHFICIFHSEIYTLHSTAQPAVVPAPARVGPSRATRHRAMMENVDNNDHLPPAVPFATQSANVPTPAQPSHNTCYRATVEDADDDNDYPSMPNATVPPPANPSIHVTFNTTPRHQHQEDLVQVEEGGPIEGKSCRDKLQNVIYTTSLLVSGQPAVPGRDLVPNSPASTPLALSYATLNPQTPPNPHLSSPVSTGEHFPTPSPSSSEDTPRTDTRQRVPPGTPRAGPHSPVRRRTARAPAGNNQRKQAKDVRAFYTEGEGLYVCLFCTLVPQPLLSPLLTRLQREACT